MNILGKIIEEARNKQMHLVTTEGLQFSLTMEDILDVQVMDEDLTDDDYIDAQYVLVTTRDGDEYLIDMWDDQNLEHRERLLDMFSTM